MQSCGVLTLMQHKVGNILLFGLGTINSGSHLLRRYKECASKQSGRTFKHAVIFSVIETKFGASWEWVEINRFEEFVAFIQERIDNTLIGKLNRNKGTPNYSSFERYCQKYQRKV